MAKLARDVTVIFRGGYPVTAKAGTRLGLSKNGMGQDCYYIPRGACDPGPCAALFKHDSTYYFVWAPADAVDLT